MRKPDGQFIGHLAASALFIGCAIFTLSAAKVLSVWHPAAMAALLAISLPRESSLRRKIAAAAKTAAILAGGWVIWKNISADAPVDILSMNALIYPCMTFLASGRGDPRAPVYLNLASMILLLYSPLLKAEHYLLFFACAAGILLIQLYAERTRRISPSGTAKGGSPFRGSAAVHLILAALTALAVLPLLPTTATEHFGIFGVSFDTNNETVLPPETLQWLQTVKRYKRSPDGRAETKGDTPDSSGAAGMPVNLPNAKKSTQGDGGNAPPSDEILFRVKTERKLYHLTALYDVYGGESWKQSPEEKAPRPPLYRHDKEDLVVLAEAEYTVEKWISRHLPSPWQPLGVRFPQEYFFAAPVKTGSSTLLPGTGFPAVPFRYRALYTVPVPDERAFLPKPPGKEEKPLKNFWFQKTPKKNFLVLPEISGRVRDLAKKITAGKTTEYAKAMALRDYLRTNYPYEQFSAPLPRGKETADWFLFEQKKGHCEYFASVLAVLARLEGLPSRVAVGFSPGDFDTINGSFTVRMYHGHAWTQIFIEGAGWLTFDATPPGAVRSRTTPIALGRLRDPFGDEWRITPPELTRDSMEKTGAAVLRLRETRADPDAKTAAAEAKKTAEILNSLQNTFSRISSSAAGTKLKFTGKNLLNDLSGRVMSAFRDLADFLRRSAVWLLVPLILIPPGYLLFRLAKKQIRTIRRNALRKKILRLLKETERIFPEDPCSAVLLAKKTVLLALGYAGFPRNDAEDLMDYLSRLKNDSPELHPYALPVLETAYATIYSGVVPPSASEIPAETALLLKAVFLRTNPSGGV